MSDPGAGLGGGGLDLAAEDLVVADGDDGGAQATDPVELVGLLNLDPSDDAWPSLSAVGVSPS